MITVYSKPNCVQCNFTKKYLDDKGVEYTTINVEDTPDALDYIKNELNMSSMPVVVADSHEPFNGFRPDLLAKLVEEYDQR